MIRDLLSRAIPRRLALDNPLVVEGEDDGSGERPVWTSRETEELSPHAAWAHGDTILQPAVEAPVSQPEPAVQLPAVDGVVYDLDWLKLPRPGRHRAPEGVR